MTPDEMRNRYREGVHAWGPAAEICERLDAIVAVISNSDPNNEKLVAFRRGQDSARTEIEKLRAALRSVREKLGYLHPKWIDAPIQSIKQTIAEALGEARGPAIIDHNPVGA